MNCVVTAGPTYEPLDEVRRLTNSSTGRLGTELANFLADHGHQVTLLVGQQATHPGECRAHVRQTFTTTADLSDRLRSLASQPTDAVFHAAAVSDFKFGKICLGSASGELTELKAGKLSTRDGVLFAELAPTPKIIASLREWYPNALLVGWKYEVDGDRASVIRLAERQIADCHTSACVGNGPAYGLGFGLVTAPGHCEHLSRPPALYEALEKLLRPR